MFEVNQIIKWQEGSLHRFERILWIENDELVTIELNTDRGLPHWLTIAEMYAAVTAGDVTVETPDLWLPPTDFEFLKTTSERNAKAVNTKRHELRDAAWKLIKHFVEPPNRDIFVRQIRGKKIRACAEQTGRHQKVIYAFLRNYWQMGQVRNALLPAFHRCGALGSKRQAKDKKLGRPRMYGDAVGVIITDYIRECFRIGYKKYYDTKEKKNLTKVFNLIRKDYFCYEELSPDGEKIPILLGPDEVPTITQFRYWVKKETDIVSTTEAREGKRRFALRYRALTGGGSTQHAIGPGSLFQIDSTVADIYLLSSVIKRRLAGRPTLYLIIDVWSRLIVGYHLTFDYPSYFSACMALLNAASNKVEHCKELGITILPEEWPSCHVPAHAVADRGELKGKQAESWTNAFGILLHNTPPYRADFKAIVERDFRLKDDHVLRWLPGHVEADAERGDRDTRLDAKLNLKWLRFMVVKWILFHNRNPLKNYPFNEFQIEAGVEPIPNQLWAWGVETGRQQLKTYPQETLRLNLLPGAKASVHPTGIVYGGLTYENEREKAEKWVEKVRISGRRRPLTVAYDPRYAGTIYLRSSDLNMEPCHLVPGDQHYKDCSWAEVEAHLKVQKEQRVAAEAVRDQNEIELEATLEYVLEQTKHEKLEGKSKREKLGDVDVTRDAERKAEYQASAKQLEQPPHVGQQEEVSGSTSHENVLTPLKPLSKTVASDTGAYVPLATNINRYRRQKPVVSPTNES